MRSNHFFDTIDDAALETVTGGRIEQGPQTVSKDVQTMWQQMTQSISQLGDKLAASKKDSSSQLTQTIQQMAGGGAPGAGAPGGGAPGGGAPGAPGAGSPASPGAPASA